MKINKSTEDMLAFYGINNLSSDIGIENLIETLNNLSESWESSLTDLTRYEKYIFDKNCINKHGCCSECEYLSKCRTCCYSSTSFDCYNCKRNNF